jgi:2-oxoglutarate ferredoxin oxidoreductase subunit gamma
MQMLFAGFGGQGIMFMGKLMAQAGLIAAKHVTWMPSYGAEVRGGTAYSMTKISDAEIASPIVTEPDILIVMNKPSLVKYEKRLKKKGILICNKSLTDIAPKRRDIKVVNLPLTAMASKLGDTRCANMIAIGAMLKRSKALPLKNVIAALEGMMKGRAGMLTLNKKAIEKGYKNRNS